MQTAAPGAALRTRRPTGWTDGSRARRTRRAGPSYVTGAVLVVDGGAHVVDVPTIAFQHAGE
ncbi:hypothetical protein [Myceligenerans halotolerans]